MKGGCWVCTEKKGREESPDPLWCGSQMTDIRCGPHKGQQHVQQGQLFCPLVEACARQVILEGSHLAWGMKGILGKEEGEQGALQLEQAPAFLHDHLLSPIVGTGSGEEGLCCCGGSWAGVGPQGWGEGVLLVGELPLGHSTRKGLAAPPAVVSAFS